jgi:hypothetical protein
LIIIGLEHERSQSKVYLNLRLGEYENSHFANHREELYIRYDANHNKRHSLTFCGPTLFGFHLVKWHHTDPGSTLLSQTSSTISDQYPSGLLVCLFIMMVHSDDRAQFINYLKILKSHCLGSLGCM